MFIGNNRYFLLIKLFCMKTDIFNVYILKYLYLILCKGMRKLKRRGQSTLCATLFILVIFQEYTTLQTTSCNEEHVLSTKRRTRLCFQGSILDVAYFFILFFVIKLEFKELHPRMFLLYKI